MISLRKIRQQLPWIDILTKNAGGWGYIPSYNPPIPANAALSAHEYFRGIFWNRNRCGRLRIRVELSKDRWSFAEMFLERVDTILISGMVRQQLWYITHLGVLEILEEPHQSMRVISCGRAHVRTCDVGSGFHVSGIAEGMQLAKQKDGQHMCTSRSQENGRPDFPRLDSLLLLHQRHGIVVDGVGNFMTQRSGEFVRILYEI